MRKLFYVFTSACLFAVPASGKGQERIVIDFTLSTPKEPRIEPSVRYDQNRPFNFDRTTRVDLGIARVTSLFGLRAPDLDHTIRERNLTCLCFTVTHVTFSNR